MSTNPPHESHSEDARADDGAPTDAVTDEVRQDAAEAETNEDLKFPDNPASTHP